MGVDGAAGRDPAGRSFGASSAADSAGQPWAGRSFHHHENPFADDDGTAPPALIEAVRGFRDGVLGADQVAEALGSSRLLIPLIAEAGEEGLSPEGRRVDKTQELSIVTVEGPDGRTVLPAFSSAAAMSLWNPLARPIPVEGRRVALAAADDGAAALVLDPGGETEFVLRRPAVWAVAKGEPWLPPDRDPVLLAEFEALAAGEPGIVRLRLEAGDPDARMAGPELVVELALEPGLDRPALDALFARQARAWAASERITDRVDSMTVRIIPAE